MAGKIPPQFIKKVGKGKAASEEDMPMKEHGPMHDEMHKGKGKGAMPMKKGMKR